MVVIVSTLGLLNGAARASPEADFWQWFGRNEAALYDFEGDQNRVFGQLAAEMHKVDPNLTFEFGPKQNGQREFVIGADGILDAFPKVESLFAVAPKLPEWRFVKCRPRRTPSDIKFNGVSVSADSVSVLIRPDGSKADLTIRILGYRETEALTYTSSAFLFLDQALGEYDTETRIGDIEVQVPSSSRDDAFTLRELPAQFDAVFSKSRMLYI
jgi:hypothetical protein